MYLFTLQSTARLDTPPNHTTTIENHTIQNHAPQLLHFYITPLHCASFYLTCLHIHYTIQYSTPYYRTSTTLVCTAPYPALQSLNKTLRHDTRFQLTTPHYYMTTSYGTLSCSTSPLPNITLLCTTRPYHCETTHYYAIHNRHFTGRHVTRQNRY